MIYIDIYHVKSAKFAEPLGSKFCGPRNAAQAVLLKRIAAGTGGGGGGVRTLGIAERLCFTTFFVDF